MPRSTFILAGLLGPAAIAFITAAASAQNSSSQYWLDVSVKARSILIDPADASQHDVLTDDAPMGIVSPDGKRIAFIGSDAERVMAGHDFDLFVSDAGGHWGADNRQRLTTDQDRPVNPCWLPDSGGIAFQAGGEEKSEMWFVSLAPGSWPVRVSDNGKRCLHLSVTPAGEIAFVQINRTQVKQQFDDLVVCKPPVAASLVQTANQAGPKRSDGPGPTAETRRILLHDQFISAYAVSPDGKMLMWSEPGTLHVVNLETKASRDTPCQGVHRQLLNHMAVDLAWSPDGKVIAARFIFAGGIARSLNAPADQPWPRMFADGKVFFIPADWTPSGESLKVGGGENYPSPTADDPKAEVSPPAGDQSKPWWVKDLPERMLAMTWITAAQAKDRIAKHPAPAGDRPANEPPPPMPPLPGQPAKKPG